MTPNLFLATQMVFSPHKWFRAPKTERPTRVTEYWSTPQPGQYEYIPGRGWFLIATLNNDVPNVIEVNSSDPLKSSTTTVSPPQQEFTKLPIPTPVHRSRVLGRYLLEPEYKDRKKTGEITNERGKRVEAGFFRLDNGVAYVHCWDQNGKFIPGGESGYKLWCIDADTKKFRHMKKGDDPSFIRSRQSSPAERKTETHDTDSVSQQSVSTAFHSRPGSTRDGPSVPSTRANSIRAPFSNPGSRTQSRRNSPQRNNSIPLEEAKAALRRMAKEQEEAVAKAMAARERTKSSESIQQIQRGRPAVRVRN